MNEQEKHLILQFLANKAMCEAVYRAIREEFLSENLVNDVQILAASRLSINLLKTAFKRMERLKKEEKQETKPDINHV